MDGLKISLPRETGQELKRIPELEFRPYGSRLVALHRGLRFEVYDKDYSLIRGSIHRYFNKGEHNWDRLTLNNLNEALCELSSFTKCNTRRMKILNMEAGVNLNTPFPVDKVLDSLICYRTIPFQESHFESGRMKTAHLDQYAIKAYDKGAQHSLNCPLMRYELKARRMAKLKSSGIVTVDSLKARSKIEALGNWLREIWKKLILISRLDQKLLRERFGKRGIEFFNPSYWDALPKSSRHGQRLAIRDLKGETFEIHQTVARLIDNEIKAVIE